MTSEVQICNQAITKVGGQMITSLGDNTNEAKLCTLHYPLVRDSLLESTNWTFATEWQTLPASADPPLSEFANAYPIPSEAMVVLFVGEHYEQPVNKWRVEQGHIVMDEVSCKCQLLMRETDPAKFSPLFTAALVAALATELAMPIRESRTLMETMNAQFTSRLRRATARDGQQGTSRKVRSRWLSQARHRDGSRWAGPVV